MVYFPMGSCRCRIICRILKNCNELYHDNVNLLAYLVICIGRVVKGIHASI